jgi:hypothetical protein
MPVYTVWNGPAPTTAAQAKVTTGTAVKTMLQLATPSTRTIAVLAWGFSLDVAPGAASVVELLGADVAATVTAHVASGLVPDDPNESASLLSLGAALTGYTATAEGAITAARVFDVKQVPLAAGATDLTYVRVFAPNAVPRIAVSRFLRVRATFATTASNMTCWVKYLE